MKRSGILFLISAPSGGGKSTLLRMLSEEPNLVYSISCTTRAPRPGEADGRDYHFLSVAEFERRIAEHDEVMECYLMTGDSDYLIRVAVADIGALEKFILNQLTPIPGIEKIRSSFALKQVRYKTALPLPVS